MIRKQIEADNIALNVINDRNNFWNLIKNNLKKKSSIPNNIENSHGIADVTSGLILLMIFLTVITLFRTRIIKLN